MVELLLAFIIGLLVPRVTKNWCGGCLVVIFGGGFALMALLFALAAGDQTAVIRLVVGMVGIALGWISIAVIKRLTG